MRKRRLYLVYLPLCLVVFYVLGVRHVPKKHQERKASQQETSLSTWSHFTQSKHLEMLVKGFGIESILDIPAEDVEHFEKIHLHLQKYIGVAPTKEKADVLQKGFGSSHLSFLSLNPTIDPLPQVDLILLWNTLGPLSERERKAALLQCKKSGAKFLLLSHAPALQENGGEQINWKLSPYNFPEPLIMMVEKQTPQPQYLGLWNLLEIP